MATGVPSKKHCQFEPYELCYQSKLSRSEVLAIAPVPGERISCGSDSDRLYLGDNLGILLGLLQDTGIAGRIGCVYIDPPYATTMSFVDRNVKHAYDDILAGAAYIEYLRRRLIVLRELLSDTGSIWVHLDQNMVFELKLVMDDVFGRKNFRNFVTRKKCNTKNYTRRTLGNVSDHILFYSKTDNWVWHRPYDSWTEERVRAEYPYIDHAVGRRYKRVPVHAPGVRRGATGKEWRGVLPPKGKHWQYLPSRLEEMDKLGEIYWSPNGNPRRKVYFDLNEGIPVQDIWLDFKDAHNQNVKITGYPTEKNQDMLIRIISAATNPGDWVLDCFCGSGTACEASRAIGRRFIGIDNSRAAIEATVDRLKNGRKLMGDFVGKQEDRDEVNATDTLFNFAAEG